MSQLIDRFGRRPRRLGFAAALALTASLILTACGGGGGSGGASSLQFVGAVAEGVGVLPQPNVALNNRVTITFNTKLDPDSVSSQTFRVLRGPDFVELAPGEIGVNDNTITFVPQLPREADFSDAGFQAATTYRIFLRGLPSLNTIRSSRGKPLLTTRTIEFTTRESEPFFTDLVPGAPRIVAVFVDLDGDGEFAADGDPSTPEAEEFFEGEVDFGSPIPFVRDVPVGSVSLPAPNRPLQVGFLFNEPLNPTTVFLDAEDTNQDGVPDGDGELDSFAAFDETNLYQCDEPTPGSQCDRPAEFTLDFEQFFVAELDSFRVLATVTFDYALRGFSRHRVSVFPTIEDFVGNQVRNDFDAVFETGAPVSLVDAFDEDFDSKDRRNSATSAHWNPQLREYLAAGLGWGGDGSDGDPIDPNSASVTIDTNKNDGIFNFSNFTFPSIAAYDIIVTGDNPAVIRVMGNVSLVQNTTWDLSGRPGLRGAEDSVAPRPGGAGGPGGGDGGASSLDGSNTVQGEDGGAAPNSDGNGKGGFSGAGPGGGGGAGHQSTGAPGGNGSTDMGGSGGEVYGDSAVTRLRGGSGGGAGGNFVSSEQGSPGSSGGSGGGGGGAMLLEVTGSFAVSPGMNDILASGGDGGAAVTATNKRSGGGGGGSGGVIYVRMRSLAGLVGRDIDATGGRRGTGGPPGGAGGAGANGYIRFETVAGNPITCGSCNPGNSSGPISPDVFGKSFGRSDFLLTNAAPDQVVEYFFDGNEPGNPTLPGRVRTDASDIRVLDEDGIEIRSQDEVPENATIQIFFRGAFEDSANPNQPDESTITPWTADVTDLNGLPMIQWEVRFDIGTDIPTFVSDANPDPPMPAVDDIRVSFQVR